MRNSLKLLLAGFLLAPIALSLTGCGCGFDCNNGNNYDEPISFSLGFSDALPEELKEVVIEVDRITLQRSNADDVVIDTFTIEEQDLVDEDSFQIDLLQYTGVKQLLVIEDMELDPGTYSGISIHIRDGDENYSYVLDGEDKISAIEVSGDLLLPGMLLSSDSQEFTVEFSLAQALNFQSSSDTYLLANDGVRVEDTITSARVTGQVDSSLFDTGSGCDEKSKPEEGNRLYLYEGFGLSTTDLADVFTSSSTLDVPDDAIAPYAVASVTENSTTGNWEYVFAYIPPGDYTMIFACDTDADDSINYDDLEMLLPENQVYEITLSESENKSCAVNDEASC